MIGGGPSSEQNPFGLTDVGDSSKPEFVDIDADGDFDAFVGNGSGQTVFFENTGSPTSPAFGAASINPFGLSLVDGMARPTLVDIDFDGDLDAFIGNEVGVIIFFPNQGSPSAPAFGPPAQDPFGLMPVDGVSTPAFADVDLDNDLDAYIGNGLGDIIYFENTGTFAAPSFAAPITNPFGLGRNGEIASPSFFDFDADGDLEPVIGTRTGANTQYDNVGGPCPPTFATGVANRFRIEVSDTNANPAFGDIDSDGDLDLFIGLNSRVAFIENLGDANTPLFAAPVYNPFGLNPGFLTSLAVTLVDINGDDLLDLCMGEDSGNTFFFLNIGTAGAPTFDGGTFNAFGLTRVGPQPVPAFGDIDDDGDLDAFLGDATKVSYFENTGTRTVPIFAAPVISPFNLLLGNISAVNLTLVDIDVDDDLDMLIGEIGGATVLFENQGTASAASFSQFALGSPFGLSNVGDSASPEFVDIDGDGDLDAFIGNANGDVFSYLNEVRSLPPATLTPAPTSTPTPEPTATATPESTATSTSQIPTASATPDGPACVGDCNGSGEVTINELVRGVNIALENSTVDQCSAIDADGNGSVAINELIQAVRNALQGCA